MKVASYHLHDLRNRLFILSAAILFVWPVLGHPPSSMTVSYDQKAGEIVVEYTHLVSSPAHFLNYTEIRRNGDIYLTENYSSQPTDDSFIYRYEVAAEAGDTFEITVDCSFGGSGTRELVIDSDESPDGGLELWILHAITTGFAFGLGMASVVMIYLKGHRWWFKAHKYFAYAQSIAVIAGLVIGIYMVEEWGSGHIRVPHSYVGLAATVAVIANLILGEIVTRVRKAKMALRKIHIYVGWVALALLAWATYWGLTQAGII